MCTIGCTLASAQGTVRGKVIDTNGETLIGVSVFLKDKPATGTVTDFDGNFSLKVTDSFPHQLMISYISFKAIEKSIQLSKNQTAVFDFVMHSDVKETQVVDISGKAVKAKDYYIEGMKRNSATTIDFVSSETMKKTGDANVTSAVARVSGVSTNGSFITVRGIGDRYIKTSINGLRIPTLDPFTNNIKLDLFPSSLVDNIVLVKTATADLPGDWAGAYLSVQTKDYPEQLSVNVESSFGYNAQSTFKDVLSSERSTTDWIGKDNGLRNHDHNNFNALVVQPSTYQQYEALGLGGYFNSMGINASTPWNETYTKLGLVKLGLLAPAQFDDNAAVSAAMSAYLTGDYASKSYQIINASVAETGKSFANNWNTTARNAPLDFSQSFSIGNQTNLFGKTFGFIGGFRYNRSMQYDDQSVSNRGGVAADDNGILTPSITSAVTQEASRETNGWSALLNAACKLNANNSISLLFMPNVNGTNNVRSSIDVSEPARNVITVSQFYEQRSQYVWQMKTEHYLPASKIKIEFNSSYTKGNSSAPDFKNIQYYRDAVNNTYQIGGTIGDGIHRYYRYLSDNLFDSYISAELPFKNKHSLTRKIKVGAAYQRNDRKSDQYDYSIPEIKTPMVNADLNALFDYSNFELHTFNDVNGIPVTTIDAYYTTVNSPANHTFGNSEISAAFILGDYSFNPQIRLSGGLRVEKASVLTDVSRFDSLSIPDNDPRRLYREGYPVANPGRLDELTFLPSVNFAYKLRDDEIRPINVRLNYSQTVARPSIRELSDVALFDYEYRGFVYGNSRLKQVRINNYDLRTETWFRNGDNASVSVFYKDFKNHIELVKTGNFTWQNVDKSYVAGIEFEGKKIITSHFDLRANVTLIKSNTKYVRQREEINNGVRTYYPLDKVSRAMFGQAPYIVNSMIVYHADSIGLSIALSYNIQGPRLVIAADVPEIPDVYELPRNLIDLKATKSISKHFSVGFTIRDILNTSVVKAYKYPEGFTLNYDKYTYGTSYVAALTYKL